MSDRLMIDFTLLLDFKKDIDNLVQKRIEHEIKHGVLNTYYTAECYRPYVKLEEHNRILRAEAHDTDLKWLEVRTNIRNNYWRFEKLWRILNLIIADTMDKKKPVGFWYNSTDQGLVYIDEPLKIVNKE